MQCWDNDGPLDKPRLWLVTPEEFAKLPDGFVLTAIDGDVKVKGKDYIDQDTRFGHTAWGATKEALEQALTGL